jgi:2-polyprenyl-3-methyl-5-hydroxy-6-metoxy-1,4-benzoquinol methylase
MTQTAAEIIAYREKAAELIGGTSSLQVYSMIERVVEAKDLRGRVLDYGAGVGDLTRRLLAMDRFDSVSAADIMRAPADLARVNWIEQDLNEQIPDAEGEYDVVIAAEVIEHLENPRFTVRELYRLLRPGGTVLISTPNNESWRSILAMLVRGHYVAFSESCYPAHITALLRKDFSRICQEAKFCSPSFHFTNQGGVPVAPEIIWQQISFALLRGVRFSDNLLVEAQKADHA